MGYRVVTVTRRLTKLAVFLLLGAIVNVAVAWGCASMNAMKAGSGQPAASPEDDLTWWDKYAPHEVSGPPIMSHTFSSGFGKVVTRMWERRRLDGTGRPGVIVLRVRTGWPMGSMEYSRWLVEPFVPQEIVQAAIHTQRLPYVIGKDDYLPLRPLWPRFAINTVFYAAILWLLTLGLLTARRMIRHKRGCCTKCGYDLRGAEHNACPECGATTT